MILVDKIGRMVTIYVTFSAVALVFVASGFLTTWWPQRWFMSSSAVLAEVLIVLSNVAFYAIGMQLCWKKVAATQFALYMALNNLGVTAGAWLTSALESYLTIPQFFFLAAFFSVLTMVVMMLANVRCDEARIATFDAEEVKNGTPLLREPSATS